MVTSSAAEKILVLAGNPNVGKTTVFNSLTGLRLHTGNWAGKTVVNSCGRCLAKPNYFLMDLPGTYSLVSSSEEERVARNYLCFGEYEKIIIVCDGVSLERNLNLVLQILEITSQVIICVNLMDEANKKCITINLPLLEKILGVPVIGTSASQAQGLEQLLQLVEDNPPAHGYQVRYSAKVEAKIEQLVPVLQENDLKALKPRWLATRLLEGNNQFMSAIKDYLGYDLVGSNEKIIAVIDEKIQGIDDLLVGAILQQAEEIYKQTVVCDYSHCYGRDRKWDKILTGKFTGIPIMMLLLIAVFWITITGANYPSQFLSQLLFGWEDDLWQFCTWLSLPVWLKEALVLGVYKVLAWVVSVMLPPMAIFFPLFTLLEDLGYLPRIAFNLDKHFKKACTCGKQGLTMCMGLGCNAVGIMGARIIDSPRERLIAVLTNSFMPCNGRFPSMISLISIFFFVGGTAFSAIISAGILGLVIVLAVGMTLFMSAVLSKTILKGVPSSFTLELPPYRKPQIGKVIVHSILDRTIFVLGRAVIVAAPAGLLIWLLANISFGDGTVLTFCSDSLDPLGKALGLDGVILLAFILGLPANEIVLPIIIMSYLSEGTLMEMSSLVELQHLLVAHGWTAVTAICFIIFSLMHWPCATTCLTIKKETGSWKWVGMSILVPAVCGFTLCFLVAQVSKLFG